MIGRAVVREPLPLLPRELVRLAHGREHRSIVATLRSWSASATYRPHEGRSFARASKNFEEREPRSSIDSRPGGSIESSQRASGPLVVPKRNRPQHPGRALAAERAALWDSKPSGWRLENARQKFGRSMANRGAAWLARRTHAWRIASRARGPEGLGAASRVSSSSARRASVRLFIGELLTRSVDAARAERASASALARKGAHERPFRRDRVASPEALTREGRVLPHAAAHSSSSSPSSRTGHDLPCGRWCASSTSAKVSSVMHEGQTHRRKRTSSDSSGKHLRLWVRSKEFIG